MAGFKPTEEELKAITEAVVELGDLAMAFGRIDRTCVVHPTGEAESDTDHTVMLAWIAPALAEIINLRAGYERYPVGKVTQYAVVHDAVEVHAGDTPTHRITAAELEAKGDREARAADLLYTQFRRSLPWFARMVSNYESQVDPVARFVRSVDKIMPKVVHTINSARDLIAADMTVESFLELVFRQRKQIEDWCPEPLLLDLYDALCNGVLASWPTPAPAAPHFFVVYANGKGYGLRHGDCGGDMYECPLRSVFFSYVDFLRESNEHSEPGEYPVELGDDGQLVFIGKQD